VWAVLVAVLFVVVACNACEPSTVEPVYDACPNIADDQPEVPVGMVKNGAGDCVPVPVNTVSAVIEAPVEGAMFVQGRSVSCKYTVTQENAPTGSTLVDSLFLDSTRLVRCETLAGIGVKTPELVEGFPSVQVGTLSLGEHSLTLKSCNKTTKVCGATTVKFTVGPRPGQIIYTAVTFDENRDFYLVDEDGSAEPVRLTHTSGEKYWPMLSPDSTKLVWWAYPADGSCADFLMANPDGSNAHVLMKGVDAPTFSPDGKIIAFVGGCERPGYNAYVMNVDGSNLRRILDKPDVLHGTAPVQPYIAWVNNREVVTGYAETLSLDPYLNRKVYVRLNIVTGEEKNVFIDETSQSGNSLRPLVHDVSPDGQWALLTTPFTVGRIMLLRLDGSGEYRWLTAVGSGDRWPSFCAGGALVCYRSGIDKTAIRTVDLGGKNDNLVFRHSNIKEIETPRRWTR